MSGSGFYYDDDESDMAGYPYFDQDRLRRSPYEERVLGDMTRANDPFASAIARQNEERFGHSCRSHHRDDRPPVSFLRVPVYTIIKDASLQSEFSILASHSERFSR